MGRASANRANPSDVKLAVEIEVSNNDGTTSAGTLNRGGEGAIPVAQQDRNSSRTRNDQIHFAIAIHIPGREALSCSVHSGEIARRLKRTIPITKEHRDAANWVRNIYTSHHRNVRVSISIEISSDKPLDGGLDRYGNGRMQGNRLCIPKRKGKKKGAEEQCRINSQNLDFFPGRGISQTNRLQLKLGDHHYR